MRFALLDTVHPLLAERLVQSGHECVALHDLSDAELGSSLAEVQGIVVRSRKLSAEVLAKAPRIKLIARVGSGTENIDKAWCLANGVQVLNSPEGNRDGVGETCVMLLLALMKALVRTNAQIRQGLWLREENRGTDLFGKTVGIIGYGHMGSAFAEKLKGFGVRVLAHDKYRSGFDKAGITECSLVQLLRESDVISMHLPLTEETRHFADRDFFLRLGRPVWFLNTSRGPVVHTEALLNAIDQGRVIAAGLDVLEFERDDLSGLDHSMEPHVQQRLLMHDRVLLTPHIAGVTHEGKVKMANVLTDKILKAIRNGEH
jgi:D-3-phosphoglycerate dehydrogenase